MTSTQAQETYRVIAYDQLIDALWGAEYLASREGTTAYVIRSDYFDGFHVHCGYIATTRKPEYMNRVVDTREPEAAVA